MSENVTKESIKAKIDRIPADKLEALDRFVKELCLVREPLKTQGESFMAKMRRIKIDAPPDFSRNIDLYMNGEKSLD